MTDNQQPETALALLYRHGLPEDVIDGALALFAQELAGKIRAHRDHTRGAVQATKVMDFAADLISPENWARPEPAAVPSTPADRPASTAPLAAGLPLVQGRCPACQRASLFLGSGGYVTCSSADCPEPDAATTVLEQYGNEAHPPSHTWKVESPRRGQWAHWFGPYDDHDWVRERYQDAVEVAPGRKFRIVRATTTYTVEQPAAVSQPGKEG